VPGPDVLQSLAVCFVRAGVAVEAVEREALVGDLGLAVRPLHGCESYRSLGLDAFRDQERGPRRETAAGADEPALRLDAEAVEGVAAVGGETTAVIARRAIRIG